MDKEKIIEKMAKDIKDSLLLHFDKTILYPYLAQDLYKLNYRKITENEIVISKEEYEKLLNQECLRGWIWKEGFNDGKELYSEQLAQMRDTIKNLKKELKEMEEQRDEQAYITEDLIQEKHLWTEQARKETAREILERGKYCMPSGLREWIIEQYGVDLGEEV